MQINSKKYNKYSFPNDIQVNITNVGFRALAFMFKPSLFLYTKALYLANYYKTIFYNTVSSETSKVLI